MYKYKTKDGKDCFVTGVGQTKDGILISNRVIENPNFELIEDNEPEQPSVIGTEVQQPNVVVDAIPVPTAEAPQPTPTNEDTN